MKSKPLVQIYQRQTATGKTINGRQVRESTGLRLTGNKTQDTETQKAAALLQANKNKPKNKCSMTELKQLAEALSETANKLAQMAVETTAPVSKYLGIEQAAEFLGMTRNQVYKLTCKRELPYYKPTGRALYFLIDDLEGFQSRGRQKSRYEENELAAELAKKGGKV